MTEQTGAPFGYGAPSPETPTPAPPPHTGARSASPGRRGAVLWGAALIAVGGLLLVNQFIPGVAIWRYWPLIIIIVGVRSAFGPASGSWSVKHAAEGLTTVAVGLIFLGQMLGYIGWNAWLSIFRLWPLLLVALGLEIAGKGLRSEWLRALGSLVVIGGLAYGALVMTPTAGWAFVVPVSGIGEGFSSEASHDARVTNGTAIIRGGVGVLSVSAGNDLATASGRSPFTPEFDVKVDRPDALVSVGLGSGAWIPGFGDARLDATLDRDVVWDLSVEAGVSSYDVDLRDLAVRALSLDAGVSEGRLTLGAAGSSGLRGAVEARIQAGISSLTLRVPEGDPVRVTVGEGLSAVDTRGAWTSSRDGGKRTYESDGFRISGAHWDIDIESGIGSIAIEYY